MKHPATPRIVAASTLLSIPAATTVAGPVELDVVLFEIDYGVHADDGGALTPLQGPVQVGEGDHDFAWSQEDGVALAEATASTSLVIETGEASLGVAGSLDSTAAAIVGDDPGYPFEAAVAQSFVNQILIAITIDEQCVLTVAHAPVDLVGYGIIEPGNQQILDPGSYDLTYSGGFATGSMAAAGANEQAFDEATWSFGVEVTVVPAPPTAALALATLAAIRRRRPRRAS